MKDKSDSGAAAGIRTILLAESLDVAMWFYVLGLLETDDIIRFAEGQLCAGVYLDEWATIIDFDAPVFEELVPSFEAAVASAGVRRPSREECFELLICHCLTLLVQGEADVVECAEFLYWQIYIAFEPEFPDTKYVGDGFGLEHLLGWLRELWDLCDSVDHSAESAADSRVTQALCINGIRQAAASRLAHRK